MRILDRIALVFFDVLANLKGYEFRQVYAESELADADVIYNEDGHWFPKEVSDDLERYQAGALNIIAYRWGVPAGFVRLGNPKVMNRAYDHLGIDKDGLHPEIQSLIVSKDFRDGAQFVLLGLVKELYTYSVANNITTWSACGKHNLYLTMRRYCKDMRVVKLDTGSMEHPVAQYLYARKMIETYFVMKVSAFAPYSIVKRCVRKMVKKWNLVDTLRTKLQGATLSGTHPLLRIAAE